MNFMKSIGVAVLGLATAAILSSAAAKADPLPYPNKVVTLVTHSSPGGGSDVFLREMTKYLGKYIGATFIVENVQGGSGAKAMARVATAPADGSVFYATTPTYIYTSLMSKPQNTYKDMDPLVNIFADSEVIYTRTDGPFKSLKDVIDHAKKERGRWGAANPASLERQAAEQLKKAAGVTPAIVTHEGGGDMMLNVLNGTLDIGIGEIQELRSQLDAGKITLLATFNPERIAEKPDVPTVKESGFDVSLVKFRGLAGPKGIPESTNAIWDEAIKKLLEDPDYKKAYTAEVLVPQFIAHKDYPAFIDNFGSTTEAFLKSTGAIK
ncbi:tripartite-type tricarboxylate transporter receptor subunit TctC [Phyllobacterium sp. 1468]|uniref:tripartite tricarboxylate transporter substrate binding protein n=1 Tax=Phyllobacterium sp. 1468 TaxID=2817759 RepID=UPI002855A185|nr:tripartite tricarboxylate transporter substrate binding protein [Phyllobacterium sp. 1468]MDR6634806.1 tripartite-type tricarboxylate transporter receptor subunit TctC [Phyllobacterium sp. 1468]